ncbi:MAG: hypothetical protein M3Y56_13065, partial [Armatimonadota bacterium]|nr:hypothetical protein [Armatimonadota bacterium]
MSCNNPLRYSFKALRRQRSFREVRRRHAAKGRILVTLAATVPLANSLAASTPSGSPPSVVGDTTSVGSNPVRHSHISSNPARHSHKPRPVMMAQASNLPGAPEAAAPVTPQPTPGTPQPTPPGIAPPPTANTTPGLPPPAPTPVSPHAPPPQPVPAALPAGPPNPADTGPPAKSFGIDISTEPGLVWDNASGLFKAYGAIKINYRGGTVIGRSLTYNPVTHVAVLKGNVVLNSRGQEYRADAISLDTNSRLWNLTNFSTTVQPRDIPNGQVVEPIYISGPSFANTLSNEYHVQRGQVTSCNLPGDSAHYWVDAKEVTLIPGNKLIMRGASFVLLGHRLFTLPSVTLSLNERTQRNQILPEFGHNQYEGYYVKEKYPIGLAGTSALLLLDLMSKKGVGKGIDDAYRFLHGTGRFHIYQIKEKDTGTNDLQASIEDTRRIGDFNLRLNSNYSKNDYTQAATTGSSQTSQNSTFGFDRSNAFGSTSADISLSTNDATASKSLSLTENLKQSFNLGKRFRIDGTFGRNLNSFTNTPLAGAAPQFTPAVGQNEFGLSFTETDPRVTAILASDVHQPFGGSQFYFVERYPELTFTTSTARLFPPRRLGPGIRAGVTGSGAVTTPSGVPVTTGILGALTPAKGGPVAGSGAAGSQPPGAASGTRSSPHGPGTPDTGTTGPGAGTVGAGAAGTGTPATGTGTAGAGSGDAGATGAGTSVGAGGAATTDAGATGTEATDAGGAPTGTAPTPG